MCVLLSDSTAAALVGNSNICQLDLADLNSPSLGLLFKFTARFITLDLQLLNLSTEPSDVRLGTLAWGSNARAVYRLLVIMVIKVLVFET